MTTTEANEIIEEIASAASEREYSGVGADTPYFTRDVLANADRFADAEHKALCTKTWNTLTIRFPTVFRIIGDGQTLTGDTALPPAKVGKKADYSGRQNRRPRTN